MSSSVVIVGDSICGGDGDQKLSTSHDEVYLRGFNTFAGNNPSDRALLHEGAGEVVAAISGHIEVTERVISVKGLLPRYQPEIGDVVVGRIVEVSGNKWHVDVNSTQTAIMLLSSVTEPGGILRRRGRGDELGMRQIFDQDDLVAAEVQRISPDGVMSLHTRAADKYGRLSGLGILVSVRPSLVKRAKHQFVELADYSTQLIIGMNGNIWICSVQPSTSDAEETEHATDARQNVARVANCIKALGAAQVQIHPASIEASVAASLDAGLSVFDVSLPKNRDALVARVADMVGMQHRRPTGGGACARTLV
ncbi:putative exosome complex exonuclease [Leishmania major strain Friedlin]|uniref:Putative exosome complex exonuclease n=1 Tax=Leishmania major TaxID=5664 RepID=Q4QFY3_LEIMA|nr:putative exosome complex exonuclease [Leishmania major strain Friedlin]CAG9571183.1 exosome_complex_exonuclease_-_putative [Leishmania major strain Friedlin]CAJ02553.1 putative exosome complex exonuclease [Leishmania major strain Friedlin]|eukprot:XP_001687601.1 putative exosome complex exonuclease [Leishmania major strain Friedlin]